MRTQLVVGALLVSPALAAAQPPTDYRVDPPVDTNGVGPPEDTVTYGAKGMREAGGYAGFMVAPEFHSVTVAPSFGWFIEDNVQVSTILQLSNIKAGDSNTTIVTAYIEPSYHVHLDTKTLAFAGAGFGYSYVQDLGSGLTFAIRLGTQFLIGRAGVFAPSVSYDLRTNKHDHMSGLAERAAESALRINLGYTTIW